MSNARTDIPPHPFVKKAAVAKGKKKPPPKPAKKPAKKTTKKTTPKGRKG